MTASTVVTGHESVAVLNVVHNCAHKIASRDSHLTMDGGRFHKTAEVLPLSWLLSPQTLIISAFLVAFFLLAGILIPNIIRMPADVLQQPSS